MAYIEAENLPDIAISEWDAQAVRVYLRLSLDRLVNEHRRHVAAGESKYALRVWRAERVTPMFTMLRTLERTTPAWVRNNRKEAAR